jgi:aminoglycoside phosphotransferase family enzyme/predicted kinase
MNLLIQNLQKSSAYHHPVKYFKLLETHISWIILTGDFAYKIKKPVDFEFLNYSTLEKRKYYCEEEVKLNKVLAPELYLEVVSINGSIENPQINGSGEILDYAVKMREFSQENLFTKLLARKALNENLIEKLAQYIAEFHQKTPVAPHDSALGSPANVHAPVLQNFDQMLPMLTNAEDQKNLLALQQWANEQFQQHQILFQERKDKGFIRDCHGDLHLGNIILYHESPILFDRIEFNDEFRWTDIIADIAFLAMDLEEHQESEFANQLINTYFKYTGDYTGLILLPYYQAYRAIVRAKITLFRLAQTGLNENEKKENEEKYRNLIALAESYMQKSAKTLMITCGLSGSGKSSVARFLVKKFGMISISSDVERKRLSNLLPQAQSGSALNKGIYLPEITEKTYAHLKELAALVIRAGYSVIVDAAFLEKSKREVFQKLAQQLKITFIILHCSLPHHELEKQINLRLERNNDPSEANVNVLIWQEKVYQPPEANEKKFTIDINPVENTVSDVDIQINLVKKIGDFIEHSPAPTLPPLSRGEGEKVV